MNHKMKLIAAIIAGMGAVSAQAGIITATAVKTFAVENFGAAVSAVKLPIVSYQIAQPITGSSSNPNTFFVDVTLQNGAVFSDSTGAALIAGTAPTLVLTDNTLRVNDLVGLLTTTLTATTTTLRYQFTVDNSITYPSGTATFALGVSAGGTVLVPTTAAIAAYASAVNTVLGVDNGPCATPTNNSLNMTIKMFDSSGTNEVDMVGTHVDTAVVARSTRGLVGTWTSAAAYNPAESAKIDVLAAAAGKTFIGGLAAPLSVNLGSFKLTNQNTLFIDGANPYGLAAAVPLGQGSISGIAAGADSVTGAAVLKTYNGATLIVKGNFTGFFSVGVYTDATCSVPALGGPAIATITTGQASVALPAANTPVNGVSYFVCGTSANATALVPSQYTGYLTVNKTTSNEMPDAAAGAMCPATLYATDYNGAVVTVRNYSSKAANASGWNQYTRVINTGATPANLKAFYVNGDGTTSTSTVLSATPVPVGGNITMSNTDVEAAIGAPEAGKNTNTNPRLRIVASTGSLRVQNYIVQPSGAWFEASGGQDEGVLPAGAVNVGTNQ